MKQFITLQEHDHWDTVWTVLYYTFAMQYVISERLTETLEVFES